MNRLFACLIAVCTLTACHGKGPTAPTATTATAAATPEPIYLKVERGAAPNTVSVVVWGNTNAGFDGQKDFNPFMLYVYEWEACGGKRVEMAPFGVAVEDNRRATRTRDFTTCNKNEMVISLIWRDQRTIGSGEVAVAYTFPFPQYRVFFPSNIALEGKDEYGAVKLRVRL